MSVIQRSIEQNQLFFSKLDENHSKVDGFRPFQSYPLRDYHFDPEKEDTSYLPKKVISLHKLTAPSASSIASTITTSASLTNAQIATATQAISNGEITVVYDFSRLVEILNSLGVLS